MLKPQLQPNKWSCLPTAFAILADIPVEQFISSLNHDGSDIIDSNNGSYRGFHPQEIIDYFFQEGKYIIHIQSLPMQQCGDIVFETFNEDYSRKRLANYICDHDAVLTGTVNGKRHAVAWDYERQIIVDPSGQEYNISLFDIENVFLLL